jgi:hypothetical protein
MFTNEPPNYISDNPTLFLVTRHMLHDLDLPPEMAQLLMRQRTLAELLEDCLPGVPKHVETDVARVLT